MYKVNITSGNKNTALYCEKGIKLSDLLTEAGFTVPHPCGGRGRCGKCTVLINGKKELCCQYTINGNVDITLPDYEKIVSESGFETEEYIAGSLVIALDIGTTTLAMAAVSPQSGKAAKVITANNPQSVCGLDVMSRIKYCMDNGPDLLKKLLIASVQSMVDELKAYFGIEHFEKMYAAGNTTMLHTFLGVDCSSIGVSPYTPDFLESKTLSADELGIDGVSEIITLPNISAFAGADITAGIISTGTPQKGKKTLLTDLGTNAEIALISENEVICTSAAAGPCFEGARISSGMNASAGAISHYSSSGYTVIGNCRPKGICGTGLIDCIAYLIENKYIDETGYLENDPFVIAGSITVTQEDIREYQLAKSAVCSAITTLLSETGTNYGDIDRFCVAGGFSAEINIDSAVISGLFPKELKNKFIPVYNTSIIGTAMFASYRTDLPEALNNASFLDISQSPVFSEAFIGNMYFNEP